MVYGDKGNATNYCAPYALLKKPEVQAYLKELQAEAVRRYGDAAEIIARELLEDIVARDEHGNHLPNWQKSADLLQKQLGLQQQKQEVKIETTKINVSIDEE